MIESPEFIERLFRGEENAFRELFMGYGDRVYNTILSIVQNKEDAEDLSQEVFITIYKTIRSFRKDSKLSTWVYRISVNRSLEFLRNKKRKKRFSFLKSLDEDENTFEIPDFDHPGVALENKELSRELFKAINALPENQKTAFVLSQIEVLSYKEISEVMDLTIPSVESLLFRARQNLKKLLEDFRKKA